MAMTTIEPSEHHDALSRLDAAREAGALVARLGVDDAKRHVESKLRRPLAWTTRCRWLTVRSELDIITRATS